jgi:hypothetical protein
MPESWKHGSEREQGALKFNSFLAQRRSQAVSQHLPALAQRMVDPAFATMHQEPPFQRLLKRTGHTL